ncbi:hypothetical protein GSI_02821 [Ganoderma sinense ZZ0214-1]|uniref:Uncharacterized protein n=1 Tax=Ganoderma sinense ZZ0214-1 TaxID=1077348 RepID=A0A2G8SMP2_9APHY|nr:hypothetical protein GSI_02821 [Ganoderma sinense ZZ0214-1]
MSSQQSTVITFQVSGVTFSDGSALPAVKQGQVFIVECSPHGHLIIVKGPRVAQYPLAVMDDSAQDEVMCATTIDDDLQVTVDVPNGEVNVYTSRPRKQSFSCPFRLTFVNATEFWRFCGAFSDAKVVQIRRTEKLLEAYEEAVDRIVEQLKLSLPTA